jgi:cobalamin biosynthesis Mg chelatase CobN
VAILESTDNQKYIKSIGTLNSTLGQSSKTQFNINFSLNQNIFSYIKTVVPPPENSNPVEQLTAQQNQPSQTDQTQSTTPAGSANANSTAGVSQASPTKSSEKLITSFHVLLTPEVQGILDETNYTVTLNVPYGTDVKNLTSSIVISPDATVSPESGVSQDFTSPVTYVVTAQDGTVQNYTVKAIIAAPPVAAKKVSSSGSIILSVIIIFVILIVLAVIGLFIWKKFKKQKSNY